MDILKTMELILAGEHQINSNLLENHSNIFVKIMYSGQLMTFESQFGKKKIQQQVN